MRYVKKIYIICFLLINIIILTISTKSSYANIKDLTFNNLNMEQGISQSTAKSIFQDSKGYIWIGTNDGLNRFNGYEYKVYNYEDNENGISNNSIIDITEDDKENIWVTTDEGINKINIETNKISKYTNENHKIKNDNANSILKTKDGKIIVATYGGLYIYNVEKDFFEKVLDKKHGLISNTVYCLKEDSSENIWVGTDLGINKISKDFKVLETYKSQGGKNSLGNSSVYTICCDDKNYNVWVGTSDSGMYKINTVSKKIKAYKNNLKDKNSLPSNKVYNILKDEKGNLWIGTDNGLACYNEKEDNFKIYKNKPYDKNSLVYNSIRCLFEDQKGTIWVGTYSGISLFNTINIIENYKSILGEQYLLAENRVQGVYEDDEGYLWVGSSSKGISIINLKNNTSKFINAKNTKKMTTDVIKDIDGYKNLIFVGTDEGVLKIDKKAKTIKSYTIKDNLVNNVVNDIFVDDKGYLWVGTIGGLSIINIETDEIIDMTKYIGKDKYINSIYEDKEGNYYLGLLKQGGLCYINVKDKEITYYKNEKHNEQSISSNSISYINGDNKDNIWVGTSYGVNKFNKKTKTFKRYTTKDGLSNNTVRGILVGDENNIWVSTNKGISKIDEKHKKIQNLSIIDGLQGNEFSKSSCYKNKDGKMYFGGINGLNSFYPKDINNIDKKPKVLFDTFKIDGKEYTDINNMEFDNDTNEITIKFFSPLYSNNKNLTYEYELEGTRSSQNKTKNNYVTYNGLYPGKYTFKVAVIDNLGNKSKTQSVTFTVKPPFWVSKWAIFIYIIIILLIFQLYKHQLNKLDELVNERTKDLKNQMEKNERLNKKNLALEKNKNNYLINLSHELRTPLNVINSTNQVIETLNKNHKLTDEKINHYIGLSQKNCKRLLGLINDILDNSKLQNNKFEINLKETDIVYLVEETALTLVEYTKSKGINLIIDPLIEEKTIKCDAHEIERCVVNLISNAIKFTPEGGSITVGVEELEDKVKINVQDTGIGIDKKFHKSIFDRFNQVPEDEVIKGGSGLGLTITSQIVKLHKGEIYVESELGKGSNFVIILPIDPDNIKSKESSTV